MEQKLLARGLLFACGCALLAFKTAVAATGATAGSFDVTPDGSATYALPISVPPGTAGMEPKLRLQYSSRGGNGLIGVGWTLSGLSTISRCSATHAQDGFVDAADFDETDRLCLDGARLILVSGQQYGTNGSEYRTELEQFVRVRQQGGDLNSGNATFKVWTKSGLIKEYGVRNNSAFGVSGQPYTFIWSVDRISDTAGNYIDIRYASDPDSHEHYVDRINYTGNDQVGVPPDNYNSIRFEYDTNRPDQSSRYMVGGSEKIAAKRRLEQIQTYAGGALVREYTLTYATSATSGRSLLAGLQECANTGTGMDCLPATTFEWTETEPGFTEVASLTPPFNITDDLNRTLGEVIDIDGDGTSDYVKAYDRNGFHAETWLNKQTASGQLEWQTNVDYRLPAPLFKGGEGDRQATLVDVNGDSLPDLVEGHSEADQRAWLNTGSGWQQSDAYKLPRALYGEKHRTYGVLVDLTGNGVKDLIISHDDSFNETYLNVGPTSSCNTVSCAWQRVPEYDLPSENMFYEIEEDRNLTRARLQDVNGDGLTDYILSYTELNFIQNPPIGGPFMFIVEDPVSKTFLNTGSGWNYSSNYNMPASLFLSYRNIITPPTMELSQLVDVNGDGLLDIVCAGFSGALPSNVQEDVEVAHCGANAIVSDGFVRATYLNTGDGFESSDAYNLPTFISHASPNPQSTARTGLFLDLNNDFLPEFVQSHAEYGRATLVSKAGSSCSSEACKWQLDSEYYLPFSFFDTERVQAATGQSDLDGRLDFIVSGEALTNAAYISNGTGLNQPPPDLIKTITPGPHAAAIGIEYTTLLDDEHYTPGASAYPDVSAAGAYSIVATSTRDGGTAGSTTVRYEYKDLRINALGRGVLGFRRFTAENLDTRIRETTEFAQAFPYVGMVTQKVTESLDELGNATTLTRTINTLAVTELGSGTSTRFFPYVAVNDEQFFDLENNTTPLTTVRTETTYDDHGNATEVVQKQFQGASPGVDIHTSVTTNQYTDDVNQWFLGRLTHSTVTKANPDGSSLTRETAYEYDAVTGLLTAEITEPNDPDLRHRTDYEYDSFGNQTEVMVSGADIASRTTTTTWDSRGQFKETVTNALGHTETHTYSAAHGGQTSLTGPNDLTTTWSYDVFGRETQQTAPDGTTVTTSYEDCGASCPVSEGVLAIRATGSDGSESLAVFDRLERQVLEAQHGYDGNWIDVVTQYDNRDRKIAQSAPHYRGGDLHWTTFAYDDHNRLRITESPTNEASQGGRITEIVYDGLIIHQIDSNGKVSEKHENAAGRTVQVVDALSGTTDYEYDPYGNQTQVTDAVGNVTTITYDKLGRKIAMDDPDMGQWTYEYDVLGNLISQTDAKGQTVTFQFDKLGRKVQRSEPEGTTTWTYDTDWIGKPSQETAPGGFERDYAYDSLGRVSDVATIIDSQTYTVSRTYDGQGRVDKLTYPSGFAVRHTYTATGHLDTIVDDDTGQAYWQLDHRDAFGNIEMATYGNGHSTVRNHDNARGHIDAILTGTSPGSEVQSLNYEWDKVGNLLKRIDQNQNGLTEEFEYDDLYRLTGSTLNDATNLSVTYDAIGNITSKSGVGSYTYGANGAGPHAVTQITGTRAATYSYDANGNMIQGAGRTLTWTSFNKPATITRGQAYSEFLYGPDRARYKHLREREEDGQLVSTTIHYVDGLYERHHEGTGFKDKHYLTVDGEAVAIKVTRSNGTEDTQYLHKDHLGSITAITNDSGAIVEEYAYDAFGKRRGLAWDPDSNDNLLYLTIQVLDRGFTSHEHLDHVGLIHMNGRVYDPILGRFMSADPVIQFPKSTQGFSRYTYVNNNPLSYTDPSGLFLDDLFDDLMDVVGAVLNIQLYIFKEQIENPRQSAAIGVMLLPGGQGFAGFMMAMGQGFAAGMILSGGNPEAGLMGAVTAGAFWGVGTAFEMSAITDVVGTADDISHLVAKSVVHGLVGGASSDWAGGSFTDGFLGAASGQFAGGTLMGNVETTASRVGMAALIGGTAAEIGGGKFANGAITAAFGQAFNERLHKKYNHDSEITSSLNKDDWELIDTITPGDGHPRRGQSIKAGQKIALDFRSDAGPLPTHAWGARVSAYPLNVDGTLQNVIANPSWFEPIFYSSLTGQSVFGYAYILNTGISAPGGYLWNIRIPPQATTHGNTTHRWVNVYKPRGAP